MRGLLLLIITTTVAVTWIARRSRAQSTRTVPIRHRLERAAGIVLSCLGFHVPTSYRHLQFEVLRGVCALIDVSVTGAVRVPHAVVVSLHPDDHVRLGGGNLTVFCQDVVDHIGVVADTRGWGHQPDLQIAVEPTDHAPLGSPQVSRCAPAPVTRPTDSPTPPSQRPTRNADVTISGDAPTSGFRTQTRTGFCARPSQLVAGVPPITAGSADTLITIGRGHGNDVELSPRTVSGHHCVLRRSGHGWTVEDLASTNGTWVNGERINSRTHLTAGDTLELSRGVEFRVV